MHDELELKAKVLARTNHHRSRQNIAETREKREREREEAASKPAK